MTILIKKYSKIGLFLFIGLITFNACNKDFGDGDLINYDNTVKSKIDSLPQFSLFKELYKYCDSLTTSTKADVVPVGTTYPSVGGTLGSNFITGFIPTNDAFKANGIETILVANQHLQPPAGNPLVTAPLPLRVAEYARSAVSRTNFGPFHGQTSWQISQP